MLTFRDYEVTRPIALGLPLRVIARTLSTQSPSLINGLFAIVWLILSVSHTSAQSFQDQTMIKPQTEARLPEGQIFLPNERLTIVKDVWKHQRRIHLQISNSYIPEREIHVFLKLETDELPDLVTDRYELFFTGPTLALTSHSTGKKIVFEVDRDSGRSDFHIQHGKIDKLVSVIGISVYFQTCPRP